MAGFEFFGPSDDSDNFADMHNSCDTPQPLQSVGKFLDQRGFDGFNSHLPDWQSAMDRPQAGAGNRRFPGSEEYCHMTYDFTEPDLSLPMPNFNQQPLSAPFASQALEPLGDVQHELNPRLFGYEVYARTGMVFDNTGIPSSQYATSNSFFSLQQSETFGFTSTIPNTPSIQHPQLAETWCQTEKVDSEGEQPSDIEQQHSSHYHHNRLDKGGEGEHSADLDLFEELLGDNRADYFNNVKPFLDGNQEYISANNLTYTNSAIPAPPPSRALPEPLPAHQAAQDNTPGTVQPEQGQLANQGIQAPALPHANPRQPPPSSKGKRGQRNMYLYAKGLCIWCRRPNPNLTKMGCPTCLPLRAAKTVQWRKRKLARQKAQSRAGDEEGGEEGGVEEKGVDGED